MRVFISATVAGPYQIEDDGGVYGVNGLWHDADGNFRRAYAESDYPQMQTDFAEWPDANGNYPDAAAVAAAAQWNV